MTEPLLEVHNLKRHYPITEGFLDREVGRVRAVDGINFEVDRGETFGIVGESGCGKSTAAETILHLETPTAGAVYFDGENVTAQTTDERKRFRRRTAMLFQDPDASFDPRMTVGESVTEPLAIHGMADRTRRRKIGEALLERVGLDATDVDRYPHEFSGGQKQRIALARALSVDPDLLIADEPVSALDVSVQAEILSLLDDLQSALGLSVVVISHDLGVVREICDRVAVMYLGTIVEQGPTEGLFSDPAHPYTKALLESIPTPDPTRTLAGPTLSGDVPSPSNPPSGCRFHTRCPAVIAPEGYDLDDEEWRALLTLRTRLHAGEVDVEQRERDDAHDLVADLRTAHNVPEGLSDPEAEAVLEEALELAVIGETHAAEELLAAEFETPCRSREPEHSEVDDRREAACHLLDCEAAE